MSSLDDPAPPAAGRPARLDIETVARAGLAAAVLGVLVVALAPLDSASRTLGGAVLLAGWLAAAWGLHRYGRAG